MLPSMLVCTIRISPSLRATTLIYGPHRVSRLIRTQEGVHTLATHNQLDGISECRIHQSTNRLTQFGRQLLRRKAQQRCQRDNGQKVEHEDSGGIPPHSACDGSQRHKYQEHVHVAAGQGLVDGAHQIFEDTGAFLLIIIDVVPPTRSRWKMTEDGGPLVGFSAVMIGHYTSIHAGPTLGIQDLSSMLAKHPYDIDS